MFDFFRRKFSPSLAPMPERTHPLPAHLTDLLTPDEYNQILQLTVEQISLKGRIDSIAEDGVITIQFEGQKGPTRFYMDNLLRKCKAAEATEWHALITAHVKVLPINSAAITYIYKDFDFAAPLLKVQVKSTGFAKDIMQDCVYRQDFPDTYTFLVIDFEEALHYVRRSEIGGWEVSETYLFEVALDNIAREELNLTAYEMANQLTVYSLFHHDFAIAAAIELARNAEEAIGPYGAVVSIPAKGAVFAHAIEADTVMEYVLASHQMVRDFYTQEVYSVSDRYYWYYEGLYEIFPMRIDGNNAYLSYPAKLVQLLEE
jgi:hypothetical protein